MKGCMSVTKKVCHPREQVHPPGEQCPCEGRNVHTELTPVPGEGGGAAPWRPCCLPGQSPGEGSSSSFWIPQVIQLLWGRVYLAHLPLTSLAFVQFVPQAQGL